MLKLNSYGFSGSDSDIINADAMNTGRRIDPAKIEKILRPCMNLSERVTAVPAPPEPSRAIVIMTDERLCHCAKEKTLVNVISYPSTASEVKKITPYIMKSLRHPLSA